MPGWTPEQDAALEAEVAKRAESAKAADAAKATPPVKDKGEPPAAKETSSPENVPPVAGEEKVTNDEAGDKDKGKTPESQGAFDVSFLPEDVRSRVHFDDEKSFAAVKSGWMAHAEATKKFQEAGAIRRDAENYRAVVADEEVGGVLLQAAALRKAGKKFRLVEEGQPTPKAEEPEFDPFDPKAHERIARKAVREELGQFREELERPSKVTVAVNSALEAYAAAENIDQPTMIEAIKMADAALVKAGRKWDPEQVAVLMPGYVEAAKAKKPAAPPPGANKAPPSNGHKGTEEASSPVGRGGPHQTHVVPPPAFYVDGHTPNRRLTNAEWDEENLYRMRLRFGPNVTIEDIRSVTR